MKNEVLPAEIQEMAKGVSVEKRNEVQSVLNKVFNGVSRMREQLDSIVVVDEINNALQNIPDLQVSGNVLLDQIKYYQEVKKEITNLK